MADERDRTDGPHARQLEEGHTRHTFERFGSVFEVDVREMSEAEYARHAGSFGAAHSAARLPDRVRVVRIL